MLLDDREWTVKVPLRPWQEDAFQAWREQRCRGVVEAATGTGKSILALKAIELLRQEHRTQLRVVIIVPTLALVSQWRQVIRTSLSNVTDLHIGEWRTKPDSEFDRGRHAFLITTINSARRALPPLLEHWQLARLTTLLIVDECHRTASRENRKIYDQRADFTLGLSATPNRDDELDERFIYPNLGRICFRYGLQPALDDGVLSPVLSINFYVDFSAEEREQWEDLSRELGGKIAAIQQRDLDLARLEAGPLFSAIHKLAEADDSLAASIVGILAKRREVLSFSGGRAACCEEVMAWLKATGRRALVFHEAIADAQAAYQRLRDIAVPVSIDHSQMRAADRSAALKHFRIGKADAMTVVKALDEGIDVPEADVAVISAGSRSLRQRIQRIGRVLRHQEGKEAVVISILVRNTPEESRVGARDDLLLGAERVRHHRWPTVDLLSALTGRPSSYTPDPGVPMANLNPNAALVERFTLRELGFRRDNPALLRRMIHGGREPQEDNSVLQQFSINRWYPKYEVADTLGIPHAQFDAIVSAMPSVMNSDQPDLIHGVLIGQIAGTWSARKPSLDLDAQ